jgi:hypothetical protein
VCAAFLDVRRKNALVMPGLDPGVHRSSQHAFFEEGWITVSSSPVMTIPIGMLREN